MKQRTAVVNSSGTYVNLPYELQDRLAAFVEATNSNKSRVAQEALNLYLSNTKEVNEVALMAIALQKKGADLTPILADLRAQVATP